jgi:hypothetical protein
MIRLPESGAALLGFAFLGGACFFEWRSRRVPNWWTLPALLIVAAWRAAEGDPSFLIGWALFFCAWRWGLIGGADAKVLMTLSGLWPGSAYVAWLGGGLVIVYGLRALAQKRGQFWTWAGTALLARPEASKRQDVFLLPVTAITLAYFAWGLR